MTVALRRAVRGGYRPTDRSAQLRAPNADRREPAIADPTATGRTRAWRPGRRRFLVTVAAAVVTATLVGPVVHAQPDEEAAAEAAREIAAAQDQANEAAAAWTQAGVELETLEADAARLEQERAALQAEVDVLRASVEQAAVERFMASGSEGIPLLTGYQQPLDQLSAEELGNVASGISDDAFDQFDVSQRELQSKADELAATQEEVAAQREEYDELAKAAVAEVEHLQEVEEQRLADEQVRLALLAQQREEERRRAEQAAAEAAQRAAEEAQRAAEQAAADQAAANQAAADQAAAASSASSSSSSSSSSSDDLAQAPSPEGTAVSSDDGGEAAQDAAVAVSSSGICPVQGPTAYSDTWGAARSGGRRHEGVDMISPEGTTLVAVASGSAKYWTNSTGALGVSITADDGTRYYYGHLSSYEGSDRRVGAGEVVGYVGSTGATSVAHLHFEIHPGGGAAVNPYSFVVAAGC